jgi:predicted S18 family serine protease
MVENLTKVLNISYFKFLIMVKKGSKNNYMLANTALVLFLLLVGILIGASVQRYVGLFKEEPKRIEIEQHEFQIEPNTVYINVPAVDNNGKGVSTKLGVRVKEGTGKTLVDIDGLLYWVDTQNSIRMAKLVAENITGIDTDKVDIIYTIDAKANLIGGESAGAALTISTIAALENKKLKEDVMITGTVNHDGSMGPIGGVLEKAQAAKESGAHLFLVPLLQSREVTYEEKKHCEKFGLLEWCNIERIPVQVDVGDEAGIEVKEVGSILEALQYFIEDNDSGSDVQSQVVNQYS